ncbi:MAG: BirA family transcriptional regulator [Solirubrobacteraceae bacterium]|nr:BirA family transcriptional regulator [Solirubrobacteraceae bacterium]
MSPRLGTPWLHLRTTDSTNDRARALASSGAPHGTLVTAGTQTAGRGRQGRTWQAPAGRALLMSLVLRDWPRLLPLAAAVAVADVAGADGADISIKWPNDILLRGGKLAGILVEARPQEGWAVVGIGMNVAVRPGDLPKELRDRAASLELEPSAVETTLAALLAALGERLALDPAALLAAFRARDALLGREVRWQHGEGTAAGIDEHGRLLVDRPDGTQAALDAGEVHLARAP